MKITTPEAYRKAIERINELRNAGETAEANAELAELDGAANAYEALPDVPDESKGRPTPKPYEKK